MYRYVKVTALVLCLSASLSADVPAVINHQGLVRVEGKLFHGPGIFRFAFVDVDTGINLWSNDGSITGSVGGVPASGVSLPVSNGVYSVALGDTTLVNMVDQVSPLAFEDGDTALRIWFDDGVHGNQQLAPDHPLATSPYSFRLPNVTVDASGNVGIGVKNPTELLDVASNSRTRGNLNVNGDAAVDNKLKVGGSLPSSATLHVVNAGGLGFLVDDLSATSPLATIQSTQWDDVGTVIFEVVADSDTDSTGAPQPVFSVRSNGFIYGRGDTLLHSPSDGRLKQDIAPIPSALEKILKLRGVNFKWRDACIEGDALQMGLIAQEVEEVFPEVVTTANDDIGTKAIEYEHLVAGLVEAIKELDRNIKTREARIAEQAQMIQELSERLTRMENTVFRGAD